MAFGVLALSLAWAIGAVVTFDDGEFTTYAAFSPSLRAADAAGGLGLILAGAFASWLPSARRLGLLALLASIAWFGPDWEGNAEGPALLRTLGEFAAPFLPPLALHFALVAAGARHRAGVLAAAYGLTGLLATGRALTRDPLLDLYCWSNCSDNSFLVHGDPSLAEALGELQLWAALAIAIGVVVLAAQRLVDSTRPARRLLLPLLAPALLVAVAEGVYSITLLRTPLEDPREAQFEAIFLVRSAGVTLLALGLIWNAVRALRTQRRVARLAAVLGAAPAPGKLQDSLAASLSDPEVEVRYMRGDTGQLVDADGRPADPPAPGRAIHRIMRDGRTIALVVRDAGTAQETELEGALGPAARLAIENEALRAEALAQVADLRASRARIVEAGDAARRRLERDLHDGAQQRLLALSYDLRLAAAADGGGYLAPVLERATTEASHALDELRDLAHGIHPAILTEAGLAPALRTLADDAPLAVELEELPADRLPSVVETSAYITVAEGIEDAVRRGATYVSASARHEADRLVVTLHDDGDARRSDLVHLVDRVGAAGGTLEVDANQLRAEIPCA